MKTHRTFALAALLTGMALQAEVASAQLSAPREDAQISYGPVSLYPTLQVIDAGKDSNVFNESQQPKEDYTFTLQSRILVVTKLGQNELMAATGSDYIWFQRYKSERSSNATYATRLNLSAGRVKPFFGAERTRTRLRPTPELDARPRRWVDRILGGSAFTLSDRTALTFSAEQNHSTYDEGETFRGTDLSSSLDARTRVYTSGVRYEVTSLTTLRVEGNYEEDLFPRSHIRDAKTYSIAPTVEFSPDAIIRGAFSAGMEVFAPADSQLQTYRGPTYNGSLNFTFFDRTTVDVRAARNVSYSYHDDQPYFLLTRLGMGVSQKLIGPVGLTAGGERQFLGYRWRRGSPAGTELAVPPRHDTADVFSAGITIALPRGFRMALAAERTRRRSKTDELFNYDRTRLLSTLTIGS